MHELGHTLGLGHPAFDSPAVMAHHSDSGYSCPDSSVAPATSFQELTEYDSVCAEVVNGYRGVLGSAVEIPDGATVEPQALANVSAVGGGLADLTPLLWISGVATGNGSCLGDWIDVPPSFGGPVSQTLGCDSSRPPAMGLRFVVPREDPATERILLADTADGPPLEVTATTFLPTHRLLSVNLDRPGPGPFGSLPVLACAPGQIGCSPISTEYAVAWAWGPSQGTVAAWVAYPDAPPSYTDHAVWIGTGFVPRGGPNGEDLITPAMRLGVSSIVAPGLVCTDGAAGDYDCLAAYVPDPRDSCNSPAQGTRGQVLVQRFDIVPQSGKVTLQLDPSTSTIGSAVTTASALTVWYEAARGSFFLALRADDGATEIWTSQDSISWSRLPATFSIPSTFAGPSAAAYFNGTSNLIFTAR